MASYSYDSSGIVPETPPDQTQQTNTQRWRKNRFIVESSDEVVLHAY